MIEKFENLLKLSGWYLHLCIPTSLTTQRKIALQALSATGLGEHGGEAAGSCRSESILILNK